MLIATFNSTYLVEAVGIIANYVEINYMKLKQKISSPRLFFVFHNKSRYFAGYTQNYPHYPQLSCPHIHI